MLDGLRRSKNAVPSYALIEKVPTRCVPDELAELEDSVDFRAWRGTYQNKLFATPY